jgi:hypothetical protein
LSKIFAQNYSVILKRCDTIQLSWRRGIMVIASASRTEDPGFKFHQGVGFRFLYVAVLLSKLNTHCHC